MFLHLFKGILNLPILFLAIDFWDEIGYHIFVSIKHIIK